MKICPQCGTQYTDETLFYCFHDGTPLEFASQAGTPTAVLNRTETRTGVGEFRPEKKRTNAVKAVMLTIFGMLILFGIVGIAAWLYLRDPQSQVVSNTATLATPTTIANSDPPSTPKTVRSPTPAVTSNINVPAKVDDARVRSEVTQSLNGWKAQAESLDLDAYMEYYAPTVDYYNKNGASFAYVRTDKMRAFSKYSSIQIDLSDISVTVDPTGETATAIMDKEWNFQGNGSSRGKVRQMIRFRRIDGEWRITAERDLKLYYKQ